MTPKQTRQAIEAMKAAIRRKPVEQATAEFYTLQTTVFVMAGGGWLGHSVAESPANGYIDRRVGALPYPRKTIESAVKALVVYAEVLGMDAAHLPEVPHYATIDAFQPWAPATTEETHP